MTTPSPWWSRPGGPLGAQGPTFASVGELCLHEYLGTGVAQSEIGGAPWYFGTQIAALGYEIRLIGILGTDTTGDSIATRAARTNGIQLELVRAGDKSARLVIEDPHRGEPPITTFPSDLDLNALVRATESLVDADLVHVPAFPELEQVQQALAERGFPLAVDFGYKPWLRLSRSQLLHHIRQRLDGVVIALLNVGSLPRADAVELVRAVAASVPVVVATAGADDAVAAAAGSLEHIPVISTVVQNSLGAGDAFLAGFVIALAEGRPLSCAARFGHATAAARIRFARPATRAEADNLFESTTHQNGEACRG